MLKHFLQTFAFRIAMMTISVMQGIIVARCLLPEGKGTIALFMTGFTLVFSLMNCGVRQSTAYALGKEDAAYEDLAKIHSILLPFLYLICAGSVLGMYFFVGVAAQIAILPFISLHLFTMLYMQIYSGIVLSKKDIVSANLLPFVQSLITLLGIAIIIGLLQHRTVLFFFVSQAIANAVGLVIVVRYLKSMPGYSFFQFRLSQTKQAIIPFLKRGLGFAFPLWILGLNYSSDIVVMKQFLETDRVGLYSQAVAFATLILLLPTMLSSVIFAHSVSSKDADRFSRSLWRKMKLIMLCSSPVMLCIGLAAPFAIPRIYGEAFSESVTPFLVLLPGCYFMIPFKILNADFVVRGNGKITAAIFGLLAILNIILNILWIPKYDILGAAYSSMICYTLGGACICTCYYCFLIRNGYALSQISVDETGVSDDISVL